MMQQPIRWKRLVPGMTVSADDQYGDRNDEQCDWL
jgi:hypothetical protein